MTWLISSYRNPENILSKKESSQSFFEKCIAIKYRKIVNVMLRKIQ